MTHLQQLATDIMNLPKHELNTLLSYLKDRKVLADDACPKGEVWDPATKSCKVDVGPGNP